MSLGGILQGVRGGYMDRSMLPPLVFKRGDTLAESVIVYDRDNSLLVVALGNENDYSGEFINIGRVCIALGESMNAVDMQIQYSLCEAKRVPGLSIPEGFVARVIFPESYLLVEDTCTIEVHSDESVMHLFYADLPPNELLHLSVARNVVIDVTIDNRLAGIWVGEIQQR